METAHDAFICEKCNKKYKNRSGLWKHYSNKHSNLVSIIPSKSSSKSSSIPSKL
jgi:hypothetical protein